MDWTRVFFVLVAAIFFLLRGMVKGIVMVRPNDAMYEYNGEPGPRSHILFSAYHWIAIIRDGALILISALPTHFPHQLLPLLPGVLLLGWEGVELAYSTTRYALLYPTQENVLGTGLIARGGGLAVLHLSRIALGFLLLFILP